MTGRTLSWCALLALLTCVSGQCAAKQLAVIVDKANTLSGVPAAELSRIFKFESRKWPDGRDVVLVLPGPASPEMQIVIEKIYHMSHDQVKALLAAHKNGVVIASSEEQLLKSVETIPGAVGVVDVFSISSHVSILKVDGKLPLEPGYLLKHGQ